MSKLIKKLAVGGMIVGAGLMFKGCAEDFDYETKAIKENKTEVFEEKGAFKDRNNGYEFVAGLLLAGGCASAYKSR